MSEKNIKWEIIDGKEWCLDEKNNKNSVSYWGSKEVALKALQSLKNCKNCSDCSYCRGCSYCENKRDEKGDVAFLLHKKRKYWYVEKDPDFYSFETKVTKVAYSTIKSAWPHRAEMFKK